jgi:hypothetical protein
MYTSLIRNCGSIGVISSAQGGAPIESALIEGCTFQDCWKGAGGGTAGLQIDGAHLNGAVVRNCAFIRNINPENSSSPGGLGIAGTGPRIVEGCTFLFNESNGRGAGLVAGTTSGGVIVRGNTFYGNRGGATVGGSAAYLRGQSTVEFSNNVVADNLGGGAMEEFDVDVDSFCNVFWNNENGIGSEYVPGPTDREVDPLFCDEEAEDFTLHENSPCLPPNSLGCGLIGAYPQGCGVIAVDRESWGSIKAHYHDPKRNSR